MMKYYSNEIVFRGHPDKVCDQISAAILAECVKQDRDTRAGIEVAGGKGKIFVTGEVTTKAKFSTEEIGDFDCYFVILIVSLLHLCQLLLT